MVNAFNLPPKSMNIESITHLQEEEFSDNEETLTVQQGCTENLLSTLA
jgi:hypothetical protein